MKIEHVALWTYKLEEMKEFYVKYFGGKSNEKYVSAHEFKAEFSSYFISFDSWMQTGIDANGYNTRRQQ